MLSLEAYNKYAAVVRSFLADDKDLLPILDCLQSFFEKYKRDVPSIEELETHFVSVNVGLEKVKRDFYHEVFVNIGSQQVSDEVVLELLAGLQRKQRLLNLAMASYEASEGRKDFSEVSKLAQEISKPDEVQSEAWSFVTDDLEAIYNDVVQAPGLRWRLKSLNQALGSLRTGNFGFVFARPETGKTTFLASEVTYMAEQASGPVLWFNNEQPGKEVMLRIYQAALGMPLEQLFSSIPASRDRFRKITKGNIKLIDQAVIHRDEVERLCESTKPALVIFDQIDKLTGFKADRDDLVLGAIYQWARELAKTYCPVIGVCQADGTGEGVKYLTMANVANAKTSKQAEADWILGIGRSNDPGYEDVRFFNVSKNKLIGDKDTLPQMRHGRWEVLIKPTIARYEDIVV